MNKKKKLGVVIIAASLMILMCLGYIYINSIKNLLIDETEVHLEETAKQGSLLAQSQVNRNLTVLTVLSNGLVANPATQMVEKVDRMKEEAAAYNFYRIGYADLTGVAVTSDGYRISVAEMDFFKLAVNGTQVVSNPILEQIRQKEMGIVSAVPIYWEGKITGVLFGDYKLDQLSTLFDISLFGNQGNIYIVLNDGKIIFQSQEKKLDSFFDELERGNSFEQMNNFKEEIWQNHSGAMPMNLWGEELYLGYASLQSKTVRGPIEDWNIIVTVPKDMVFFNPTKIINYTGIMVISIVLFFSLILFYILKTRRKNEKAMRQMAFVDPLTGIYNFNWLQQECGKILKQGKQENYGIIYFDIDNFKILNDTFSYNMGDHVLKKIAEILKECLEKELYARISSDYFAIFCSYNSSSELIDKCLMLQNSVKKLLKVRFQLVLSCGIYQIRPGENDIQIALNKANMARTTVKGKQQCFAVYSVELGKNLQRSTLLVEEIKKALEENQFEVYYQPKFSLIDGTLVGSEALIRWKNSENVNISPAIFIPIAEKSGLIDSVGKTVWEIVCGDLHRWKEEGRKICPVSINLSRVELYQVNTLKNIEDIMRKHQISYHMIEIEITETAALENLSSAKSVLNEMRAKGFAIAMDDFGTGYSSLSCLKEIPIDVLKMDRSFLDGIELDERSRNIAASMITLAKSLQLTVVIEGVETLEQAELMKVFGCDIVQGFYFARPEPVGVFERRLLKKEIVSYSI